MANANLFMFVYAHMYVLGLRNEKYVMCMYVDYVWELNWQRQRDRETERQRDRETKRQRDSVNKAQGIISHLFSKGGFCKKQNHSLQSSVWVQIKNTVFKF